MFIQADVFKIFIKVEKEEARVLCLFFNSIIGLIQFLTHRQLTLAGGLCAIRESDLLDFFLIDYKVLTTADKKRLNKIFTSLKNTPFPSIIEQIESRFEARLELDKAILEVLGYNKKQINSLLPKLYDAVLQELKKEY